jgi:peptidoglycan hydrolase CwlO-like protein
MQDRFQQQIDKLDNRFERLDDKVDNVKLEVMELRSDIKIYTSEVIKHVNGDEKIVTEIMPTLLIFKNFVENDLKDIRDIILKEKAKEITEKTNNKNKESFKLSATIAATLLGIFTAIFGLFSKFKS